MAEFEKGQFFLDLKATNISGTKGKYFITLSDADLEDDPIICFVINTEHRMDIHILNCNKEKQKFILAPESFSFIEKHSAIMLSLPSVYSFKEFYETHIKILDDKADDILLRQIKNCINWDDIPKKFSKIIKDCFR